MKQRFLVVVAIMVMAAAGWAVVNACDQDKQTAATGAKGRVTAVTANANGACPGMSAKAAAGECPYHNSATTASTAGHDGCSAHGTAATTASMEGHDGCSAHGTAATTASMSGKDCAMHGTSATTASNGAKDGCCSMKGASATTASNHDGCTMKGMSSAMAHDGCTIGSGMLGAPSCAHHSGASVASVAKECDACAQMVECASALSANAAQTQIVPLKNGVMFVYTTDTRAHVRAVQNAVARRNDKLNSLASAGDRAHLCPECRNVRGAIASGKLVRETVNTEGGCLTLVTSSDPAYVAKLRALASNGGGSSTIRTKS